MDAGFSSSQYPNSWKTFQESIPGAEIGPMPDGYIPPACKITPRHIPGYNEYLDPIEWDTPDVFQHDATNLPHQFSSLLSPLLYFSLFFDDEIFKLLAEKTNAYAVEKRAKLAQEQAEYGVGAEQQNERSWWPTSAEEMKIWVGINLYVGFLGRKNVESLWGETNGVWQIYNYMSLVRFEQIRRFFHMYGADDISGLPLDMQPSWYHKFERLASRLRSRFHQFFTPGTCSSIDESMAMCTGKTFHKTHIDRKPITDGYKIITMAFNGYVWDFIWWSGSGAGDAGPSVWNAYYRNEHHIKITSRSSLAVLSLCHTLPYQERTFVIFMDNFYSSIPLFAIMHGMGIGACGTIRQNNNLPKNILALENPESQKNYHKTIIGPDGKRRRNPQPPPPMSELERLQSQWNWLEECVLPGSVLCYGWRDNAIVTGISTIHWPGVSDDEYTIRARRRPKNPNRSVAAAFGEHTRRYLPIPKIIDDYNHNMNGVDQADQLRTYMTTHRKGRRVWLPIFWWLLDTTAGNAYFLYRLHAIELRESAELGQVIPELSHRDWMEHVAFGLIVDGFEKLNGQVPSYRTHVDVNENDMRVPEVSAIHITKTNELLAIAAQKRRSRANVSLVQRVHSKTCLPAERFARPVELHSLTRQTHASLTHGRSYCLWCMYKYDGTRRAGIGRPLEEVEDATPGSRTGKKPKIPLVRIPQTRFYCSHCNAPLCNEATRGSRQCFQEFHSFC